MKTKIKIAVIAMMGISFGMNAQTEYPVIQPTQKVNNSPWYGLGRSNVIFPSSTHEALQLGGYYGILLKTGKGDFRFDYNGNLGIGTTSPKVRLHLEEENKGSRTSVKDLLYLSSRHSSVGYNGFGTGIVDFRRTYQNSTPHAINRISFIERGHSTADRGGAITFATKQLSSGSAAPVERLRIDYNGNVGIGITSPSEKLEVNGNLLVNVFDKGNESGIFFRTGFSATNKYNMSILSYDHNNNGHSDGLSINAYDGVSFTTGSGSRNERMRITQEGNVGIGTDNPSSELEIKSKLNNNAEIHINSSTDGTPSIIRFQDADINTWGLLSNYPTVDKFSIYNYQKRENAIVIDKESNVGIGTYDPKEKLEIDGSVIIKNGHNLSWGNKYGEGIPTIAANVTSGIHFYPNGSTLGATMQIYKDGKTRFTNNVAVLGKLESKEIKVTKTPTADFVFEADYKLPSLETIEKHIKEKKHLPEIASAKEMEKNGVNVGNFQIQLLQKIEELTLYTIDQDKEIKALKNENKLLKSLLERVSKLEKEIKQLK
ncbi:exported hypothetical protein [Tenacibaculum sp. 190524A02b]|uniref:Uncharacterized protein n=1 Tax=Tenacibaculum vairaonense TaxID=3137860 RepID=A0ABP1F454_9FLAO